MYLVNFFEYEIKKKLLSWMKDIRYTLVFHSS
jgi:hypothetical protein